MLAERGGAREAHHALTHALGTVGKMLLTVEPLALRALAPSFLLTFLDTAQPMTVAQPGPIAKDEMLGEVGMLAMADLAHANLI